MPDSQWIFCRCFAQVEQAGSYRLAFLHVEMCFLYFDVSCHYERQGRDMQLFDGKVYVSAARQFHDRLWEYFTNETEREDE